VSSLGAEVADRPHVFLSLLPEPAGTQAVDALRDALDPAAPALNLVLAAPVRGIGFFAAHGELARALDAWWQAHVPPGARPVVLVMDEPGLEQHLSGLDAELLVAVPDEEAWQRYAAIPEVRGLITDDPLALAAHTAASFRCFRVPTALPVPPEPAYVEPEPVAPVTLLALNGTPPALPPRFEAEEPREAVLFMPRLESRGLPSSVVPPLLADVVAPAAAAERPLPDPFTALAAVQAPAAERTELAAVDPEALTRASLFDRGARRPPQDAVGFLNWLDAVTRLFSRRRGFPIPREIGDMVLAMHPAPVVVVPGRKGGVGKTVTAGAIAQLVGYALGDTTGSAAIVDQNIGNPDQWGRLDIPSSAGTVRQLMAALSSGMELPPTPAWAKTPALAVYPEDRGSVDAYPPGLIQRFVHQLRERHVFIVIDLPNRLPDYSSAEAAICAAYLDLADLVILPTTDDPSALLGAMEYLDIPSMRGKRVVVSHITSSDRQLRRHPVVRELLNEIAQRVAAVETIPRSEKATLAIVKGVSILEISSNLREAYVRLAQTTVRTLAAGPVVA